jgi:tRNA threonylcarbamoyladenosine biosynthesis protein TsaE
MTPADDLLFTTHSLEQTRALGRRIGRCLRAGTVIALTGDLGSGKTSLVQGFAKGLDVSENYYITSPTFNLINTYPGRHPLFHVDLYRIASPLEIDDIGLLDMLSGDEVVVVEWADNLPTGLLAEHLWIQMQVTGDNDRQIRLRARRREGEDLIHQLRTG